MEMNVATQTEFTGDVGAHETKAPGQPPTPAELAEKFPQLEILELLGRGGMGAVYKARQKELDRIVALKILPPGIGNTPGFAERFTREAKALAKLHHPNIVTLFEFGRVQSGTGETPVPLYYFLMEFVDGVTLRQLLQGSRISPHEALAIVPQICDALQFAHDHGIVHRDIKPENILMDRRGRVKVADFGLAKIVGTDAAAFGVPPSGGSSAANPDRQKAELPTSELTEAGKVMGTPSYMAPEQTENPSQVDHRADIYALGVVFYQMLTGELPGKRIEAPSKKVQIDVRLDEVVLRALEKNPELRYEQASVFKTQVENIASSPLAPPKIEDSGKQHDQGNQETRRLLKIPAIGLMIAGGINIGLLVVMAGIFFVQFVGSGKDRATVFLGIGPLIIGIFGILIILGATRMLRLKSYGSCIAGSILAMIIPPGFLLGLPFGIWSLIILSKKEVREAFEANRKPILTGRGTRILHEAEKQQPESVAPKTTMQYIALFWFFAGTAGTALWMHLTDWRYVTPMIVGSVALILALLCRLKKGLVQATLVVLLSFGIVAALVLGFGKSREAISMTKAQEQKAAILEKNTTKMSGSLRSVNSPPFIARYQQGEIELIGLGHHPSDGTGWLPNGAPMNEPFPIDNNGNSWVAEKVIKQLAYRVRSRTGNAGSLVVKFDPASGILGTGSFENGDQRQPSARLCIQEIACPPGAIEMNVQVGVADGTWEKIIAVQVGRNPPFGQSQHGEWKAGFQGITNRNGDVAISFNFNAYDEFETRMAAVNADGTIVPLESSRMSVSGGIRRGMTSFTKEEFANIKEFQLQRREYQWVEFRNVSLVPGHRTRVEIADAETGDTRQSQVPDRGDIEDDARSSSAESPLQFRLVSNDVSASVPTDLLPAPHDGSALRVQKTMLMGSEALKKARLTKDHQSQEWQIDLELTPEGQTRFAEITRANVGRQLAMIVNGRVLSAPVIQSEILGGKVTIAGNFSESEAADLVWLLNRMDTPDQLSNEERELTLEFEPEKPIMHQPAGIDLDRGEVITWPTETGDWNQSRINRWIEESGMDLLLVAPRPEPSLGLFAAAMTKLETNLWTNSPSRASLLQTLNEGKVKSNHTPTNASSKLHEDLRFISVKPPLPILYGFRTAEGTVGLMRLLEFSTNARALKVQFKQVQNGNVEKR